MKVKCIDKTWAWLKYGEMYNVAQETGEGYLIISDKGSYVYPIQSFIITKETNEMQDIKCKLRNNALIKLRDGSLAVLIGDMLYRKNHSKNNMHTIPYLKLNEYDNELKVNKKGHEIDDIVAFENFTIPLNAINYVLDNTSFCSNWDWRRVDNADAIKKLKETIELASKQIKELEDNI